MLLMELTKSDDFVYVKNLLQTKNKKVDEKRSSLL